MSLQNLLDLSESHGKKREISKERLQEQVPQLRSLIAFYRVYPDLFIDFLLRGPEKDNPNNPHNFKFYFYQRIFLRVVMRHRYVSATFPRAYSKSFLSMMVLCIRCILYPNADLFVTTGGKLIFM